MCLLSHSERGRATEPCARGAPRACCGACSRGSRRAALRSLGPVLGVDFPLFRLPGAVVTKHRKQGLKTTRVCSLMVLEARSLRSRCQWLGHAPSKASGEGPSLLPPASGCHQCLCGCVISAPSFSSVYRQLRGYSVPLHRVRRNNSHRGSFLCWCLM